MSEDKKSLIDLVPDSVDNAVKNITDKPTQNIGTTFADIWYLVFGGISQAAEKRKLKYSYALQEFEKELKEKISKIPKDKLAEPYLQVVAPALEASKYCILHKELRELFANLITSSLNDEYYKFIHPSFSGIIEQMTPLDAKNIAVFSHKNYHPICHYRVHYKDNSFDDYYKNIFLSNSSEHDLTLQSVSISSLERLGLIEIRFDEKVKSYKYEPFEKTKLYSQLQMDIVNNIIPRATNIEIVKGTVELTPYGELFIKSCISKNQ